MRARRLAVMMALAAIAGAGPIAVRGQAPSNRDAAPTTARIETMPLLIRPSDPYQIAGVLEPSRRVVLVAPEAGYVQTLAVKTGDAVRDRQEVAALDRAEAMAHLKIAETELRGAAEKAEHAKQAVQTGATPKYEVVQAEVQAEIAQARVELAQIGVDRCAIRAPFAGRILGVPISAGQYVAKGEAIAELADTSALKALVPIDRTRVKLGEAIDLDSDGKAVRAKVQALVPLPEGYAALRGLMVPWSGAVVTIEGEAAAGLEPGQRVRSPFVPSDPIATVETRAIKGAATPAAAGGSGPKPAASEPAIQVLRNERVATLPVVVLGEISTGRTQVAGPFREGDALIVSTSIPLADGTFVRFDGSGAAGAAPETVAPSATAAGAAARVNPPGRGVAPIGAPDSALPKASAAPATATIPAAPRGTPKPAAAPGRPGSVPF